MSDNQGDAPYAGLPSEDAARAWLDQHGVADALDAAVADAPPLSPEVRDRVAAQFRMVSGASRRDPAA